MRRSVLILGVLILFSTFASCKLLVRYTLNLNIEPAGSAVISQTPLPVGEGYESGTNVRLTVEPAQGYAFFRWEGDYPTDNEFKETIDIVMDDDKTVIAALGQVLPNWLMMIYMDGANNLEGEAIYDINALEYGLYQLSNEDRAGVQIIVLLDRISASVVESVYGIGSDDDSNGDWTGTRLYSIEPDNDMSDIASTPLRGWWGGTETELDMGDVNTLDRFIEWSKHTYYQYGKQALILWNHGGGAKGLRWEPNPLLSIGEKAICVDDEVASPDKLEYVLYLGEIQEALAEHYSSSNKLGFLGLDACLMGTVEVAYEFRNLVEYMSFSPALEWGSWDYENIVLAVNADTTARELAEKVVTTYRDISTSYPSYGQENTQTAVDLSRIGALKTELDQLAVAIDAAVTDGSLTQAEVETIRDQSLHYYEDSSADESIAWPYYEIGSLCENLSQAGIVSSQTADVAAALENAVVYAWAGSSNGDYEGTGIAHGLSVFFSRGEKTYPLSDPSSQYHYQWWYTSMDTASWWLSGGEDPAYYGHIDFCDSNTNGQVETWRELFEKWYDTDSGSPATPGSY